MYDDLDLTLLDSTFDGLSRAARAALIRAGLHSPHAIANSSEQHLRELEGIDDMSVTIIRQVLAQERLDLPKE